VRIQDISTAVLAAAEKYLDHQRTITS
jgi:hypothetical protein